MSEAAVMDRPVAGPRKAGRQNLCAGCSSLFYVSPSRGHRRYCSVKCRWKAEGVPVKRCPTCERTFKGRSATVYCSNKCARGPVRVDYTRDCPGCGKRFNAMVNRKERRYCSRECWNGHRRGKTMLAVGAPVAIKCIDLMDHQPDDPLLLGQWFRRLTPKQLDAVWVASAVSLFGDGKRRELADALNVVRNRLRSPVNAPGFAITEPAKCG